jgi:CheY-like chemotaxis protein
MTTRKYVLLVENETDLRDAIALIIRQHGYHVETAQDGKDALVTIANLGRPAVILLNLQMSGMDGWELREQVRQRPDLTDVPFVLISGSAHIAAEAQRLQAVDYFQKPIHFPRLLQVLSKHCK